MAAQGYQESRLDQNAKSQVGAIGVMQVMPATGKELKVGDITQIEPNIHAGVKYMRFMMDQYYKDEPMDRLEQGAVRLRVLQRGPGPHPAAAERGGEARARPEHLVRQRRADRVRAHRPRDGHLREQHLQVLRRLPARRRGARQPPRREVRLEVLSQVTQIISPSSKQAFDSPAGLVGTQSRHEWKSIGQRCTACSAAAIAR